MALTSGTGSSGVFLGADRRLRLIWRVLLAWLGFFGCVLIVGGTLQVATSGLPDLISYTVTDVGVTASALGLVFLLRRHVDRSPWSGIGLIPSRAAIPHLLAGIGVAGILTAVTAALTVRFGLADWDWSTETMAGVSEQGLAGTILMIAMSTLLVQGIPEEVVFRGYMFDNLGARLPLWATVVSTSLIFGSMHVVSNAGASTLGERLVYAAAMTGFGLMLAACRTLSSALWLGIGFHAGYDAFGSRVITIHQGAFIPAWLTAMGVLIAGAALTLALRHRRVSTARRGRRAEVEDHSGALRSGRTG